MSPSAPTPERPERHTSPSVTSLFGRELLALGNRARERYLRKALEYWRTTGFPYERLSQEEVISHFRAVSNAPLQDLPAGHPLGSSSLGLRLANSYHPQMWHARSHGHRRSPYEYYQDDKHLRAMLERAPRFWPDARCWSPQAVRNLVRIYASGRVANFRPVVARNVISGFSRNGDVIIDFSAGYGGRLLACLTLDRIYLGIDPAKKQVSGLNRMCKDLRNHSPSTVEILEGCAEDILPGVHRSSADLVFSSPPFFNLEIYSNEPTQSSHRYRKYDEWRACFLKVVLAQSRRVLRRKGFLAINVSSRARYPLLTDTLEFASKLLTYYCTVEIAMPARPLQRAENGGAYRAEPIYIFQKR
jgi:DNA modification methylase